MIADDYLAAIEARADAATPGPWFLAYCGIQSQPKLRTYDEFWSEERMADGHSYEHRVGHVCEACGPRFIDAGAGRLQVWDCVHAGEALDAEPTVAYVRASYGDTPTGQRIADGNFIDAARQDVPALVGALRAVLALVAEREKVVGGQSHVARVYTDDVRAAITAALAEVAE